jgi:hypothetical protein
MLAEERFLLRADVELCRMIIVSDGRYDLSHFSDSENGAGDEVYISWVFGEGINIRR